MRRSGWPHGGLRRPGPPLQAGAHGRDPQHLYLLFGRLRPDHVQPGRRRQERRAEHHPYRGRRRPSGQPRHPLPERRRPAGLHPQPEPPEVSGSARGRLQRVEAHRVGRSPRAHRQADEGRPRRQLRREERAGPDRQPLVDHRLPRRVRLVQRGRLHHPQGDAPSASWDSTTRRVSDTARRWQVLPRRLAVEP